MARSYLFLGASVVGLAAIGTASAQGILTLDTITVLASKTAEKAIDALAAVSNVSSEEIERIKPARLQDIFAGTPGVLVDSYADDPGVGFNLRGLEAHGRVAVVVDGARQNFEISQHGPEGKIYLDPELISNAQVARGPVANIYGSGAIGGVVSLNTKDVDDILDSDERFGAVFNGIAGTNEGPLVGSVFVAARPNENVDFIAGVSQRHLEDYRDGNGNLVANSGSDTTSGLAKATFHLSPGQDLKIGEVYQRTSFNSGMPGDPADLADGGTNYATTVENSNLTAKYTLDSPDNPLIDFAASAFWTHGSADTTVEEQYCYDPPGCTMDFTGPVGTTSGYKLDTIGYDINNSSRFAAFGAENTLTVGTDLFADRVRSTGSDPRPDAGFLLTASGERQAYGAFGQWDAKYGNRLDITGALRFDGYHIASDTHEGDGTRLSPKITVGVTPLEGVTFYGTYAEGYRAPSLNEAFVAGLHPGAIFQFLPNPELVPEIGHTLEAGLNLARDDLFRAGDSFRLKAAVFNNDVTNYIEGVYGVADGCTYYPYGPMAGPQCYQYQNISAARIRGVEVESSYDGGKWFVDASATVLDGKNTSTGDRLSSVLPAQTMLTVGARFLDDRLTVAPNWRYASGGSFLDAEGSPVTYDSFSLFGLSIAYQANKNTVASLIFNNLFDTQYTNYLSNAPGPGFSMKASLKVKLAAK
jgi:hemoglobin/transferrin/lactoferrin receptor protein